MLTREITCAIVCVCVCVCAVIVYVRGSPLDNTQDQNESHFVEFEPQHMQIKSLDGYTCLV